MMSIYKGFSRSVNRSERTDDTVDKRWKDLSFQICFTGSPGLVMVHSRGSWLLPWPPGSQNSTKSDGGGFQPGRKHLEVTEDVFLAPQSRERSQTSCLPFLESQECSLDFFQNEGLCICVSGKPFRFLELVHYCLWLWLFSYITHIWLWHL